LVLEGKLVEAMLCGTPSVTTSIGAESMQGELTLEWFIADDVEAFQTKQYSYQEKELWLQAQK
jgi:hypothetical protein